MSIRTLQSATADNGVEVIQVEITEPGLGRSIAWDAYCDGCGTFLAQLCSEDAAFNAATEHVACPRSEWEVEPS